MPISANYPIKFTPKGLVDAFDGTELFPGACQILTDLVFDQGNPELVIARPGVGTSIADFSSFTTPGFISVQVTIGTRVYGMIASGATAAHDEPFCFDIPTASFIAITGVTALNVPTSPATTGAWTPPTIAAVGVYLLITHPGFDGNVPNARFFGVLDLTNPAAPAWSSKNTATNGLTGVPTSVANFNNRAYFAVLNSLQYTDVLTLTRTSASQALTIGDTTSITAQFGLPIQTTSSGVTQTLIAFKLNSIWQITGDAATSNLALNYLSLTIGSNAPRSIALSPLGLYFAAPSGPRIISQLGAVVDVVGKNSEDPDIQVPWQNMTEPTRVAGGYGDTIYRISMDTYVRGVTSRNDYWFDEHRRRWTGPHSFPYDCASPYGTDFIISSYLKPAKLFKSQVQQNALSVFTDDTAAIMPTLLSSTLPKVMRMAEKQVIESTIELSAVGIPTIYNIQAQSEQGAQLGSASIAVNQGAGTWGSGVWGDGQLWQASLSIPRIYNVNWSAPLVFKKMQLFVQVVQATSNVAIGTFFARYQDCGYTNTPNPS